MDIFENIDVLIKDLENKVIEKNMYLGLGTREDCPGCKSYMELSEFLYINQYSEKCENKNIISLMRANSEKDLNIENVRMELKRAIFHNQELKLLIEEGTINKKNFRLKNSQTINNTKEIKKIPGNLFFARRDSKSDKTIFNTFTPPKEANIVSNFSKNKEEKELCVSKHKTRRLRITRGK